MTPAFPQAASQNGRVARFAGRSCLVTGGGRGIGRAIAVGLAREGGSVGIAARSDGECTEVAAETGGLAVPPDVTDLESCERAVSAVTEASLATRAAAPALLEHGGAVVMIASVAGIAAAARLAAYGASKAGLVQLTRTLAREWADRGVRVNALCPGYVETEMTAALLAAPHRRDEILAATPLGRLATMDEVVAPALFLASDEAAYITGAALLVDGGTAA
jgi:NAD(P)-dependent dehydrogenase (short-subunit alcohol dehydrogenase family)